MIDQSVINEETMTRLEKEETRQFYESFLLDESGIEFICKRSLKQSLKDAKKYCYIPVKNYDDLINQIKETNFLSIERASEWENTTIPILNYDGNTQNFGYYRGNYNIVNKWGHKRPYKCFKIIYSDDFIVRWFGSEKVEKSLSEINTPLFWVSIEKMINGITYLHKRLYLYPSACCESESICGLDSILLDNIVKKYEKQFSLNYTENIIKEIELDQCFKKGFFYKGPKYDFKNHEPYYDYLSKIKNIKAENGLFKIEIENITYPHSGYAFLDLTKFKITHTDIII